MVHRESPPSTGRVSRHQGSKETGPGKSSTSLVCKAVRSRQSQCTPISKSNPHPPTYKTHPGMSNLFSLPYSPNMERHGAYYSLEQEDAL